MFRDGSCLYIGETSFSSTCSLLVRLCWEWGVTQAYWGGGREGVGEEEEEGGRLLKLAELGCVSIC